jgi:hypothetical protein
LIKAWKSPCGARGGRSSDAAADGVTDWTLDTEVREAIEKSIPEPVKSPAGPEFMAQPASK